MCACLFVCVNLLLLLRCSFSSLRHRVRACVEGDDVFGLLFPRVAVATTTRGLVVACRGCVYTQSADFRSASSCRGEATVRRAFSRPNSTHGFCVRALPRGLEMLLLRGRRFVHDRR